MSLEAMEVIYHSPLCPDYLRKEILEDLINRGLLKQGESMPETIKYYPALTKVDMVKFKRKLRNTTYAEYLRADLKAFKHLNVSNGFTRGKIFTKDHLPVEHEKLEVK